VLLVLAFIAISILVYSFLEMEIGFAYMNAHISKAQIHSNTAEVLMDSEKSSNPLTGLHTAAGLTLT